MGRQAAAGLEAWARAGDVRLRIEDDRSDPATSARLARTLAGSCDLLLGPYGSGPGRAWARALEGAPQVTWNHGAAAVDHGGARIVDVLGPADSYWRGLGPLLAGAVPVAVVRGPGGFAAGVAAGAIRSLEAAGRPAVVMVDLDPGDPGAAVAAARAAGAGLVAGGGRIEDDLALAAAARAAGLDIALVVCGVAAAAEHLGERVLGALGPVQWDGRAPEPPHRLPPGCDYPAAQALAGGLIAERALRLAGSADPDALWDAARALRTTTHLGPFAVDGEGRQVAHAPAIVRWDPTDRGPARAVVWRT